MPDIEPAFLLSLLGAVLLLLIIYNQARKAMGKAGVPQPLVVELQKDFTPLERTEELEREVREGFDKMGKQISSVDGERRASVGRAHAKTEALIKDLRDELRDDNNTFRAEMREDIKGVHNRVNDVLGAVSRLEGMMESKG